MIPKHDTQSESELQTPRETVWALILMLGNHVPSARSCALSVIYSYFKSRAVSSETHGQARVKPLSTQTSMGTHHAKGELKTGPNSALGSEPEPVSAVASEAASLLPVS